jgi:protein O-mannosyl-transferase
MQSITINKKNIRLVVIGLFLFSSVIYSQTLFFDFVWDDQAAIIYNKNIQSPEAALKTFYQKSEQPYNTAEHKVMTDLTSGNWRPLRTVAHSLIFNFFTLDPLPYHLINILFHSLVVVLLFFLLLQIIKDMLSALVGALLFAVHPVTTEVVCWAKSLEDLLATFFLLLTFNLVLRIQTKAPNSYNIIFISLATLAFALALTAKVSVVFFPIFLIIFIICRQIAENQLSISKTFANNKFLLLATAVFLAETIAAIVTRSLVLGQTSHGTYLTENCWTTWLSMPRIFLRYLQIEIFPYPLYADYMNYPRAQSLTDYIAWIYATVFIFVFIFLTWSCYKKKLLAPWLWFWCALMPFSNIIAMNTLAAERFIYIPTIGFAWLAAEIFKRYSQRQTTPPGSRSEKILITTVVILFLAFLTLTIQRSAVWSNRFTLWLTTTKQFPHSQRARRNLIKSYIDLKQPEKAIPYAKGLLKDYLNQKNITLYAKVVYMSNPTKKMMTPLSKHNKNVALNSIAIFAAKRKEFENAEKAATLAYKIKADKDSYDTLNRVALYAAQNGYFAIAERIVFLASGIDSNDNTVNRVGIQAAQQGRLDIAERCFTLAAKINPTNKNYAKNIQLLQRQRQKTAQ